MSDSIDDTLIALILTAASQGEVFPNPSGYDHDEILRHKIWLWDERMIKVNPLPGDGERAKSIAILGVTLRGERYLRQIGRS